MAQRLGTLASLLEDLCSPLSVTPILGNPKPPEHIKLKGEGKEGEEKEMWTIVFALSGVSDETNLCRELEHTSL